MNTKQVACILTYEFNLKTHVYYEQLDPGMDGNWYILIKVEFRNAWKIFNSIWLVFPSKHSSITKIGTKQQLR